MEVGEAPGVIENGAGECELQHPMRRALLVNARPRVCLQSECFGHRALQRRDRVAGCDLKRHSRLLSTIRDSASAVGHCGG